MLFASAFQKAESIRKTMLDSIKHNIDNWGKYMPDADRLRMLEAIRVYVQTKLDKGEEVRLHFICTHNSRRSQLAQVWGQVAASYYGVPVTCYSGGVEVTSCNERTIASLRRSGFLIRHTGDVNPVYYIQYSEDAPPIACFSKKYNDSSNPAEGFAAIMTCDHADEHCPYIPGADARFSLRYEDPKAYDDQPEEAVRYDLCSQQISGELFYLFSQLQVKRS